MFSTALLFIISVKHFLSIKAGAEPERGEETSGKQKATDGVKFSQRWRRKTWDDVTWAVHTERRRKSVCLCVCVFTSIPGLCVTWCFYTRLCKCWTEWNVRIPCWTPRATLVCVIKGATSTAVRWNWEGGERWSGCSGSSRPAGALWASQSRESPGQSRLQFRRQKHTELRDDAACDQLMRSDIERRVPDIDTWGAKHREQCKFSITSMPRLIFCLLHWYLPQN